jgi:hypothetical protein
MILQEPHITGPSPCVAETEHPEKAPTSRPMGTQEVNPSSDIRYLYSAASLVAPTPRRRRPTGPNKA